MTFYIRPRQDLSISSFAKIVMVLEAEHRNPTIICTIDCKTGKPVTRIYLPYDLEQTAIGAIDSIAKWANRNVSDFKLVKVGDGDYDPFKEEDDDYDPFEEDEEESE